jgi:DNA polymerase IV
MREILHVDMDAFFASVEQRDDPSLRGRPLIVGGPSRRGVVLAASYEARPFGVHSAMPMAHALRLCPHALVVPPRQGRYGEVSGEVFAVFHRFTPLVEGLSVDEAFLDVTGSRALFGDGRTIARRIKDTITAELGLTASAGVAPSKFVAKIASDLRKPDGLVVVAPEEVVSFLAPLPIERMWGIGPKSAPRLREAGFATLGDLAAADLHRLEALLGRAGAQHVQTLARGIDGRPVNPERIADSIGAEETFEEDIADRGELERKLLGLAGRVARRLLEADRLTDTITVKVKYADFTLRSRQLKLPEPVADTASIHHAARALLRRFAPGKVRLVGISASGMTDEGTAAAPGLFPDAPERRRRLEQVVVQVGDRFGGKKLRPAALLEDAADERGSRREGDDERRAPPRAPPHVAGKRTPFR